MTNQILRLPNVMQLTGLARSTIYYKIAEGTLPSPIKLSKRASGWLESEVNDWIEAQNRPCGFVRDCSAETGTCQFIHELVR